MKHKDAFDLGLYRFMGVERDYDGQDPFEPGRWASTEAMEEEKSRRIEMAIKGEPQIRRHLELERRPFDPTNRLAENNTTAQRKGYHRK